MLIRCTQKLLKEAGLKKDNLFQGNATGSWLDEWYANLFFVECKKCVIFSNARTLFTTVAFDVKREQIRDLGKVFRDSIGRTLLEECFEGALIQDIADRGKIVQYALAVDKSVLGIMVDHVKNMRWLILERFGGLGSCNFTEILKEFNRTPLLKKTFGFSIEEFRRLLGIKSSGEPKI